jgi:hypothetical protein
MAPLAVLEHKALKAKRVGAVKRVLQEMMVLLVKPVSKVQRVKWVILAKLANKVQRALLEHRVILDLVVTRVKREPEVKRANRVLLDLRVSLVQLVSRAKKARRVL